MKLSVFNPILNHLSLEEAIKYLKSIGVDAMEVGMGGYPGTHHADAVELSKSDKKVSELRDLFKKYNLEISAISVHGNGVHPNKEIAVRDTNTFLAACKVAAKLEVGTVVSFSGCPGYKNDTMPNWVTCTWPEEYHQIFVWQWENVLIPYWKEQNAIAKDYGVRVALEMHAGMSVYNPATMLRLREECGDAIGANVDPSHLEWQGIDAALAVRHLGSAVHFVHAKDTVVNKYAVAANGVLVNDRKLNESDRPWYFRTVGYGQVDFKALISSLKIVGYDGAVSIEHEDSLMTPKEGLEKAVYNLKSMLIYDNTKGKTWW